MKLPLDTYTYVYCIVCGKKMLQKVANSLHCFVTVLVDGI